MVVASFPFLYRSISKQCISAVPSTETLLGRTQVGFTGIWTKYHWYILKMSSKINNNKYLQHTCKKVVKSQWRSSIWRNQSLDRQGKATAMHLKSENHSVLLWKLPQAVSHQEVTSLIDILVLWFTLWRYNNLYFDLVYAYNVHKNNIQYEKKEKYQNRKFW